MTPTRARRQASFPEAGKPRLAVAPPGSSAAWTAASPRRGGADFDPDLADDHVRFDVRLRALVLGECPPVARIRALGILGPARRHARSF
jgi:hypothetical protein